MVVVMLDTVVMVIIMMICITIVMIIYNAGVEDDNADYGGNNINGGNEDYGVYICDDNGGGAKYDVKCLSEVKVQNKHFCMVSFSNVQ